MESRVLSIQSHVVRGYVGNKSATFPLQILGFDVDAINSVHFSNHTGYKCFKGQVLDEKDLGDIFDGLNSNGLNRYSHLLTGYVGSPSFLLKISEIVRELKSINSDLLYVCDPVMGDNGAMYVPETLLPIYRDTIIPLADVITPNQYELELLTGKKLKKVEDAWEAIDSFHEKGCKHVVVSSSELGDKNNLLAFASSVKGGKRIKCTIDIPKLNAVFTGTGDLFAALLLGWMHKTDADLIKSLENTIGTLQAVLKRTLSHALELSRGFAPNVEQLELRLIQSKCDIENPESLVKCRIIN